MFAEPIRGRTARPLDKNPIAPMTFDHVDTVMVNPAVAVRFVVVSPLHPSASPTWDRYLGSSFRNEGSHEIMIGKLSPEEKGGGLGGKGATQGSAIQQRPTEGSYGANPQVPWPTSVLPQ